MSTTTVDLIYFNAGGGHRASALALEAALQRQRPSWRGSNKSSPTTASMRIG